MVLKILHSKLKYERAVKLSGKNSKEPRHEKIT